MNKILLFYKYIHIQYPEAIRKWQRSLCEQLNLKGRILIAHEGINGTVGGSPEAIDAYISHMQEHELFKDVDFKSSCASGEVFPKLKVKVRPEVVRLGIDPQKITAQDGGKHLTPTEVNEVIAQHKNLVILDARNKFEAEVGKFKDAIVPPIEYFRQLPEYIDNNLDLFKDKEVLMYCTGGIRCERASAYLKSKGVAKQVYQIKGGIHRYIEEYPDGHFRGKNYVFDGRITIKANEDVIAQCLLCNKPCDDMTNCVNTLCNNHFVACQNCLIAYKNTCGDTCLPLVLNNEVMIRTKPAKTSD